MGMGMGSDEEVPKKFARVWICKLDLIREGSILISHINLTRSLSRVRVRVVSGNREPELNDFFVINRSS